MELDKKLFSANIELFRNLLEAQKVHTSLVEFSNKWTTFSKLTLVPGCYA